VFLFGYPTPDPCTPSSEPIQPTKLPGHGNIISAGYFGSFPDWAQDGSFLAFRRLSQDVPMFWNFVRDTAEKIGITEELLASYFVGRWKSGVPLMRAPTKDNSEMAEDPLKALSNNNFFHATQKNVTLLAHSGRPDPYEVGAADPLGNICPFAAHMRKVNPRDNHDVDPGFHRIIRRGAPYGRFIADRYKDDGVPRGLLFMSYQSSLLHGTVFIQKNWANPQDAPKPGGHDFIIGQPNEPRVFCLNVPKNGTQHQVKIQTDLRWVKTTGGGFYFVPPIKFFDSESPLFADTSR